MAERQLAVVHQQTAAVTENEWSDARKKFILDNYCNNAPAAVAMVFLGEAMRRGLSPEAKQIYLIPRRDTKTGETKWITQTSIDGYRVIADRTRRYAGSDDAVYLMRSDGKTPERATMTVYKMVEGQRCPFTASAYWDEYNGGQNLWKTMPRVMLAKCSEALALRKAFPAELSGLYTDAEMDQAEYVDAAHTVQPPRPHASAQAAPRAESRETAPGIGAGTIPATDSGELTAAPPPKDTPLSRAKRALWVTAQAQGFEVGDLHAYARHKLGAALEEMPAGAVTELERTLKGEADLPALLAFVRGSPPSGDAAVASPTLFDPGAVVTGAADPWTSR